MKYDFYKHPRSGAIVKVEAGLKIGEPWVRIAEGVSARWSPDEVVAEPLQVDADVAVVEPVVGEVDEEVEVGGLDWLFDGEPNNFASYAELRKEGNRDFPARVGEQAYEFNGKNWVRVD